MHMHRVSRLLRVRAALGCETKPPHAECWIINAYHAFGLQYLARWYSSSYSTAHIFCDRFASRSKLPFTLYARLQGSLRRKRLFHCSQHRPHVHKCSALTVSLRSLTVHARMVRITVRCVYCIGAQNWGSSVGAILQAGLCFRRAQLALVVCVATCASFTHSHRAYWVGLRVSCLCCGRPIGHYQYLHACTLLSRLSPDPHSKGLHQIRRLLSYVQALHARL